MNKTGSTYGDKGFVYKSNFMRNFILNEFYLLMKNLGLNSSEIIQVGVVGGYEFDPELKFLRT